MHTPVWHPVGTEGISAAITATAVTQYNFLCVLLNGAFVALLHEGVEQPSSIMGLCWQGRAREDVGHM